ncbi:MAG: TonB-dependent receptor plug domain-containing protein [Chitinophagaceae bacterium]
MTTLKQIMLTSLLILGASLSLLAQSITYKGRVLNAGDKSAVSSASIKVKGTSRGVSADTNGDFSIEANANDQLEISSVGFNPKTVKLSSSENNLIILLEGATTQLNEVLVTALGVKKDVRRIGYAIQDVKAEDLSKAREPNVINSLKGNVAGLVIDINPEISRAPSVSLRGEGRPIFVVDGVPINSDTWNINPDDIESFTILKGPNAAALYGFAGRNGAIIINTKKGNKTKKGFSVDVNSSTLFSKGFLALPKYQDLYGPGEYGKYAFGDGMGGGVNDADYDIWGPKFEGQLLPQYDGKYDPTQTYVTTFPDGTTYEGHIEPTPWIARGKDNLKNFIQTGILTSNSIAVSSSTDKQIYVFRSAILIKKVLYQIRN